MIANAIIAEHYLTEKDNTDADEAAPTLLHLRSFLEKEEAPPGETGLLGFLLGGTMTGGRKSRQMTNASTAQRGH